MYYNLSTSLHYSHIKKHVNGSVGLDFELSQCWRLDMGGVRFSAVGDSFITRRLPHGDQELMKISSMLNEADVRFSNLEVSLHNYEVYPSSTSGGTWAAARPAVLDDLQWLGFNLLAAPNNHSLDWCHEGVVRTCNHLDRAGWIYAGIGCNLAEASVPRYIETPAARIALVAVTSTCPDWHAAGDQRPDMPGRPGVNLLRFNTVHQLPKDQFEKLKEIIEKTDVNAARRLKEKEGHAITDENAFYADNIRFKVGNLGTVTTMNNSDASRIERAISEAKRQADIVIVSHHAHEMRGEDKSVPAMFIEQFAKFCIDSGAHAYLGHGPHILRGIEIYRDRPIFYSLGNFIFQNDCAERQPNEFFDLYGLDRTATTADGFDAREAVGSSALSKTQGVFESVIANFEIQNGRVSSISCQPITLGFGLSRSQRGKPILAAQEDGRRIVQNLHALSKPYGTVIEYQDGLGVVKL